MTSIGTYALVCGRWDSELIVVDLALAARLENAGTDRAIVNRVRVATGRDACALPVSVVVCSARGRAYVVNHGGRATQADAGRMPHGHRGTLAVVDLKKAVRREEGALLAIVDLPGHGPVGAALGCDGTLFVTCGEGEGTEDGGFELLAVDPDTYAVTSIELNRHGQPCPNPSPDPGFGRYPNPNGIAATINGAFLFTANGGTNDVSVLRYEAPRAPFEIERIRLSSGGFGIALSPDQRRLAVTEREDAATGRLGTHVLLAEVGETSPERFETHRIRVGTDDVGRPSRPTGVAFARDGKSFFVTGCASGTVSRVDLTGEHARETFRRPVLFPRGVAVTPDGRHLAVAGGRKNSSGSGTLSLFDTERLEPVGSVSHVGNEPYFLAISEV